MKINKKINMLMLLTALSQSAFADNTTTNMQTSATMNSTCSISATDISFGAITLTSISNVITSTGTLSFLCSNNISVIIALNAGNAGVISTAGNTRYMLGSAGNTDKLYYGIFRPVGFGPGNQGPGQWVDAAGGPFTYITTTTNGTMQTLPMLARLNTNQIAMPDNYQDTIIATMTY